MHTCNQYNYLMWLSYARGFLDSDFAAEMQSHSESCNDCQERLEFSRRIATALDLSSTAPPESWTDEAVATFQSVHPSPAPSDVFGELVFDSFLHDKEAVRSRSLETRHLLFDLPGFEVDLALEYSGRQLKVMIGHLLSKGADSATTVQDLSVELRAEARTYSATANRFGEFLITVDAAMTGEPLELRCALKGGQCAIVLIPF
jgi:hypothetical protein